MSFLPVQRPYKLEKLSNAGNIDISEHVISIDKFTDVGTGEIVSSQIMVSTIDGQFLTETNDNTTPLIIPYDEYRLTMIDDNEKKYSRILFVDDRLPQQASKGQTMEVEMYGREMFLKKMKIPGHFFFITYIDLIKKIIAFYNSKRGTEQPEIVFVDSDGTDYLDIPVYPVGIFSFGLGTNCYDAIMAVIRRLIQPVSAGGGGDFFELLFREHSTDQNKLICNIKPLGKNSGEILTVFGKDVGTFATSETRQPYQANTVVVEGQIDTGSLPVNISEWNGKLEEFNNFRDFDPTVTYEKGIHVRYGFEPDVTGKALSRTAVIYKSINPVPANGLAPPVSGTFWSRVTVGNYVGTDFDYSPWTKNKAQVYRNSASNIGNNHTSGFASPAITDSNLIVNDNANYRNYANFRISKVEDIPSHYLYTGTGDITSRIPEDTRVLIDPSKGTLSSTFSNNDKFGVPYRNNLCKLRNGQWIVTRITKHNDEMAIDTEGINYVFGNVFTTRRQITRKAQTYNPRTASWKSMSNLFFGNDCFHYPSAIRNVKGLAPDHRKNASELFNKNSAIETEFTFAANKERNFFDDLYNGLLSITQLDFYISQALYNYGWWGTLFEAPFPKSSFGGVGNVGNLFKPSTLDLNNRNVTHDGIEGYESSDNTNDETFASDLGKASGICFLFNFDYYVTRGGILPPFRFPFVGDLSFRVTMYDSEDNVWISDFKQRFLAETQLITIPASGFRIYRARNPTAASASDVVYNLATRELKILDIFETRKIKKITMQWQESYDSSGRFAPHNTNRAFFRLISQVGNVALSGILNPTIKMVGKIDGFHFIKTPVAVAKNKTEQDKRYLQENILKYPNISNIEQLKKIARAELDLSLFQKDNFVLKGEGVCDLKAGESVYYNDQDLTNESDKEGTPNTKKLAVKKINYSVNSVDGEGGFIRHLIIKDRINL